MKDELVIKDKTGEVLEPGDIVIYADNYPSGRQAYFGQISHLTDTHRLAIKIQKYKYIPPPDGSPRWRIGEYIYSKPLDFFPNATIYRDPSTVILHEKQINVSN